MIEGTDMIENVARAIWTEQRNHWGRYRDMVPDLCEWEELTQSKQRELLREAKAAIAAMQQAQQWQGIESAPLNTPVEVKVGSMTLVARLVPDASYTDDMVPCDQWQAEIEGEHPHCWSGGACWALNEDEIESLQPTAWRFLPTPPAGGSDAE